MLLTKKGLKIWVSGMIVVILSTAFSVAMESVSRGMEFWELLFIVFVLFPLVLGWVQRWYWTRGEPDDTTESL